MESYNEILLNIDYKHRDGGYSFFFFLEGMWRTADNKCLEISKMETTHLKNAKDNIGFPKVVFLSDASKNDTKRIKKLLQMKLDEIEEELKKR